MQTQTSKLLLLCWLYLMAGFFAPSMAQTEPAQIPLTSNAAPVKPNILLMLDTSGSMKDDYVAASHIIRLREGGWGEFFSDLSCTSDAYRIYHSPLNNEIYYNPEKTYLPGYDNSGTQNAPEAALITQPAYILQVLKKIKELPVIGAVVRLFTGGDYQDSKNTAFTIAVAAYNLLPFVENINLDFKVYLPKTSTIANSIKNNSRNLEDVCNSNNYDEIRFSDKKEEYNCSGILMWRKCQETKPYSLIKNGDLSQYKWGSDPSPFSSTKPSNRKDCNSNPSYCTVNEERINIANWSKYHSRRLTAAKTGIGTAFAIQTNTNFRLGYSGIYVTRQADTTTANNSVSHIYPVADWDIQKTRFYTWLNSLTANGTTPLRTALDVAGQYFKERKDGVIGDPYNSNPAVSENAANQLSCRRNHTILVTDGAWDKSATPSSIIGNSDNISGPEIFLHNSTTTKYQYSAGDNSDPRNRGKQDLISGSDKYRLTLADVAHYYWSNDLRANLANNASPGMPTDPPFWQNMTTHTAGFGTAGRLTDAALVAARAGSGDWYSVSDIDVDEGAKLDDLIHAAHNGGGKYMPITDAQSFATEIAGLVEKITAEIFSQAGLAVSSNELASTTKRFIPYFTSGTWWGNLKMQSMDEKGNPVTKTGDWQVVTTDATGTPTGSTIPPWTTRKVYTWPSGSSASLFSSYTTVAITSDINAFILGDTSKEGTQFRKRMTIMGDIVNSTPTFIKNSSDFGYELLPSSLPGAGSQYAKYMKDKKARSEGVVFVGANDGMLHGFREGVTANNVITTPGGAEVFAYIPRAVLPKIHELSRLDYSHKFFVDGPITEVDAFINAPTPANSGSKAARWTNMIVGSLGAGGKSVFAIDVTDPLTMNEKSVLWEFDSNSDLGFVMGEIQAGVTASGDWVAIFGNGKYSTNGTANLFILNLSDGTLLKKMTASTTSNNGLGAVRLVRNNYNQIIGAYAGDLLGNMWRFDLSAKEKANWPTAGEKLYTATNTANQVQSITAAPEVIKVYQYIDSNSVLQLTSKATQGVATGYMVTFGTGKLYDTNDQTDTTLQSAYGIWDKSVFGGGVAFSSASKAQLFQVTMTSATVPPSGSNTGGTYYSTASTATVNWNTHRGWYINYVAGQRTIYPFKQYADSVIVNSVIPRSAPASCSANTPEGMNLIVNPLTGQCPVRYLVDTNNDGKIDTSDDPAAVLDTNGDGKIDQSDARQYCGWVGPVVGPPVFLRRIVTDDVNKVWKLETSMQTPKGQQTGLSDINLSIKQRDWRQIFPRQ